MDIGAPELIIILIIVVLVFGVGRLGKIGGELGGAIRQFRQGLNGDQDSKPAETAAPPDVMAVTPAQLEAATAPAPQSQPGDTTNA